MHSARSVRVATLLAVLACGGLWLGRPAYLRAESVDKLLPPETEIVLSLDLQQFQKSPLFKKYLQKPLQENLQKNKEFQEFEQTTKINVLTDIHTVSLALTKFKFDPTNPQNVDPKDIELLIIVRGAFAKDALVKALKSGKDVESQRYQDHDIFVTKKDEESQRAYICVAENGLVLLSNQQSRLQKSLDSLKQSAPAKVKKQLGTVINAIPPGQTIWLAFGELSALKELAQNDPNAADFVDKLVGMSISIAVQDKVTIALYAHGKDRDAAKEFRAGFEKARGFLALLAGQNEQFGPIVQEILNNLKIGGKDTTAALEIELSEQAIQKIVKTVQDTFGGAIKKAIEGN